MMYLEQGLPDPELTSDFKVKRLLMAIKRDKGCAPVRRNPITPGLMGKIYQHLDMGIMEDVSFWAICVIAFFGLLRISNVIPRKKSDIHSKRKMFLTRDAVSSTETGLVLTLRHSKTIQFKERSLQVPLPFMPGHTMCPVTSVYMALLMSPGCPDEGPVFVRGCAGNFHPILYGWFMKKLRSLLKKCGVDACLFGSHSFRRGGASWALKCGMSGELVRILGDWKSDAYRAYLEVPLQDKLDLVTKLADQVRAQVTTF